jgi:hypothetical protein
MVRMKQTIKFSREFIGLLQANVFMGRKFHALSP